MRCKYISQVNAKSTLPFDNIGNACVKCRNIIKANEYSMVIFQTRKGSFAYIFHLLLMTEMKVKFSGQMSCFISHSGRVSLNSLSLIFWTGCFFAGGGASCAL